jgi:hypothetical protein
VAFEKSSARMELFLQATHFARQRWQRYRSVKLSMTKDNGVDQRGMRMSAGRAEDGLGPTTDIGSRLRALYGAVQDEGVPEQLLDLLERLDNAELAQVGGAAKRSGE